jgi:LytS/YehU family sensor histidine kinase
MLRYQLYECNGQEIPVEKEVEYLRNYVELQRLRKDESYTIEFTCSHDVRNFTIAPLLLIPFVENSFKYLSHFVDRPNRLSIRMLYADGLFALQVLNTKDGFGRESSQGGIGLRNVKRRLDLLYPGRHSLLIHDREEEFSVELSLQIESP